MRKFVLLFAAALAFHLAGTWTLPLIDRDEPRFAEASREMMQRGDYVVPFFNNNFRFDKPPLTYWFQNLSYRAFGVNDFAARFPSCVAAALTACVLLAWGRRAGGERVGWFAAIIFTTSLQVAVHAKAAVADMWLVLFVTLAHWAGYELLRDRVAQTPQSAIRNPRSFWWLFYFSLGVGFLAKGPIAWTPLLTLAVAKWMRPEVKLNRRFLFFTGMTFAIALVAAWGIPALQRTHGEFLRVGIGKHVVARSVIAMEGHGGNSFVGYIASLPFYFIAVFLSFAPWSVRLPWLARKLWQKRDPLDLYLIAGAAVIFVVFTLVKTKLPHYTLPAFPLLALLLATNLEGRASARLGPDRDGTPEKRTCGSTSRHSVERNELNAEAFVRRMAVAFACVALLIAAATPFAAKYFPSWDLIRQARGDLTREMEFGGIGWREPSLVWYARKYVDGFMSDLDEQTVRAFMSEAGPRFVVMPTATARSLYPNLPNEWKSYSTRGFSTVTGKRVELTLLLKPS